MLEYDVIFIGFCLAFVAVEYRPRIRLFERKPFNCMPCMTGWLTLGVALWRAEDWWWYFFIGVTVGSLFEAIKMRWL